MWEHVETGIWWSRGRLNVSCKYMYLNDFAVYVFLWDTCGDTPRSLLGGFWPFLFSLEGVRKRPFDEPDHSDERHHVSGFGLPSFDALLISCAGLVIDRDLYARLAVDGLPISTQAS